MRSVDQLLSSAREALGRGDLAAADASAAAAIRDLEARRAEDPRQVEAWLLRGDVASLAGDPARAAVLFETAALGGTSSRVDAAVYARAEARLASMHAGAGRMDLAEKAYLRAIEALEAAAETPERLVIELLAVRGRSQRVHRQGCDATSPSWPHRPIPCSKRREQRRKAKIGRHYIFRIDEDTELLRCAVPFSHHEGWRFR